MDTPLVGLNTDKVKEYLRNKNVKLWLPPYSDEQGNPGNEALTEISKEISEISSVS